MIRQVVCNSENDIKKTDKFSESSVIDIEYEDIATDRVTEKSMEISDVIATEPITKEDELKKEILGLLAVSSMFVRW